jgi:hypothetical protein
VSEARQVLELLLREQTPEDRERLTRAWERFSGGDPESLPALYALADRFSLDAHAALLGEMRTMHESIGVMAREIGNGASATVKRTEQAATSGRESAEKIEALIARFEQDAKEREQRASRHLQKITASAESASNELAASGERMARGIRWRNALLVACIAVLAGIAGHRVGGEVRIREDRSELNKLLSQWEAGDREAYDQIIERVKTHREAKKEAAE